MVIGAGAIGGVTAAFMKEAGWDVELVCRRQETVDKIAERGVHIIGVRGEHFVEIKAVKDISSLFGTRGGRQTGL